MANALQAVLDRAARQAVAEPVTPAARPRGKTEKPAKARDPAPAETPAAGTGAEADPAATPGKFYRPVRDGRRFVGAHFHPEVARQLRMIAAEDDTTIQALLEEAIDLLLAKKGRATMASLIGREKP